MPRRTFGRLAAGVSVAVHRCLRGIPWSDLDSAEGLDERTAIGAFQFKGVGPLVIPLHAATAVGQSQPDTHMLRHADTSRQALTPER